MLDDGRTDSFGRTTLKIACLGAGSEYVLQSVAREAVRRGHDVVEIDMYQPGWRNLAAALAPGEFILLTSHHLFLDAWQHQQGFGFPADVEAVPRFIARYSPRRSYFIPHDLSVPLSEAELAAASLFDGLLMPDDRHWFLADTVAVTIVGWAKATADAALPPVSATVMPSEVAYFLRQPDTRFTDLFEPVLRHRPRVKFPQFAGIDRLEALARDLGGQVVDASIGSTALLFSTSCLVTNGISSVLPEAARLGLPVACICDGIHSQEDQRKLVVSIPGAKLLAPVEAGIWLAEQAGPPHSAPSGQIAPLDFDTLFAAIMTE